MVSTHNLEDTLQLLDFAMIRDAVAQYTSLEPSKVLATSLTPKFTADEVSALQSETREGITFLNESGTFNLPSTTDAADFIDRAELGGVLTGLELFTISESLRVLQQTRSSFVNERKATPLLYEIASDIPELDDLLQQFDSKISTRGEILDSATPDLGSIRQQVRDSYQQAVEALQKIIHSPIGEKTLQDQVISIRSERLVLQVKSEMRPDIPGIVHDASNTGATLFIEPFESVDLCNTWRELTLSEQRETQKVLSNLSGLVGSFAEDIRIGLQLTARLDFIIARAQYSINSGGIAAAIRDTDQSSPTEISLLHARHPLLAESAIPISLQIKPDQFIFVITGPNTGGKTVSMKTVGLLALLHQSGLYIPAVNGSILPIFDGIYADIGDQQSVVGSVSTFSSHMLNVISILESATPNSLVLLDELGTSTDPEEGSALAKAILSHLANRGVMTIATTHHRSVATFADSIPSMINASVGLDGDTLRPTYKLTVGVPGQSYAIPVATELGLAPAIIDSARDFLDPQMVQYEGKLSEVQNQQDQLRILLEEAVRDKAKTEVAKQEIDTELNDLQARRDEIIQTMRRELSNQYEKTHKRLRRADAAASWNSPSGEPVDYDAIKRARKDLESARQELKALDAMAESSRPKGNRPLRAGDSVSIRGLNLHGKITSLNQASQEAEVAVGEVKFNLALERLELQEHPGQSVTESPYPRVSYSLGPVLSTTELHIRGKRAEEAMRQVEEFLNLALRDGISTVRIVHGKGSGILSSSVGKLLADNPMIKSYGFAEPNNGGTGVTVVELN
ncbi:MAG: endonuclease MutS2 [SAR202 cluster bacterium]|nr:endonuclease MutS2 [SAR202 cluster bacterium]